MANRRLDGFKRDKAESSTQGERRNSTRTTETLRDSASTVVTKMKTKVNLIRRPGNLFQATIRRWFLSKTIVLITEPQRVFRRVSSAAG